jgi:hypothetical protein
MPSGMGKKWTVIVASNLSGDAEKQYIDQSGVSMYGFAELRKQRQTLAVYGQC